MRSTELEQHSDEALIRAFVAHKDMAALEVLLLRHEARVFGMAHRILGNRTDAADATQDVFLTVLRRAGQFRHESAFTTWLFRLTTNACHDMGRRRGRTPVPIDTLDQEAGRLWGSGAHPDPDARIELEQALQKLVPDQRAAVVMRDLYAMSYQEIGRATGSRVGTVKSRIARGRLRLAEILGPQSQEPAGHPNRLSGKQ